MFSISLITLNGVSFLTLFWALWQLFRATRVKCARLFVRKLVHLIHLPPSRYANRMAWRVRLYSDIGLNTFQTWVSRRAEECTYRKCFCMRIKWSQVGWLVIFMYSGEIWPKLRIQDDYIADGFQEYLLIILF